MRSKNEQRKLTLHDFSNVIHNNCNTIKNDSLFNEYFETTLCSRFKLTLSPFNTICENLNVKKNHGNYYFINF